MKKSSQLKINECIETNVFSCKLSELWSLLRLSLRKYTETLIKNSKDSILITAVVENIPCRKEKEFRDNEENSN
jgi:hypothetical protein